MRHFNNLVEAIEGLKKEGYTYDFNLLNDRIQCKDLSKDYPPNQFFVEEVLHFEGGDSSPETRSILYVIKTDTGKKGVLVEAGSMYDSDLSKELLEKLRFVR